MGNTAKGNKSNDTTISSTQNLDRELKKKWLKSDVKNWKNKGIISERQYDEILKENGLKRISRKTNNLLKFNVILTILGAIFLLLGVGTIFSGLWTSMGKILKLIIVFLTVAGFYGCSYYFMYENKKYEKLGKWLMIITSFIYGAAIFLLINIFKMKIGLHIPILIWAIGVLIIGILEKNSLICNIASLVFTSFSIVCSMQMLSVQYIYIPIFLIILFFSIWFKFKSTLLLNLVGFLAWLNFINPESNYIMFNLTYFILLYLLSVIVSPKIIGKENKKSLINIFLIVYLTLGAILTGFNYNNFSIYPFTYGTLMFLIVYILALITNIYNIIKSVFKEKKKKEIVSNFSVFSILVLELLMIIPFGNFEILKFNILSVLYSLTYLMILLYVIKKGIDEKNTFFTSLGVGLFILIMILKLTDQSWNIIAKVAFFIVLGILCIAYNFIKKEDLEKFKKKVSEIVFKILRIKKEKQKLLKGGKDEAKK